MSAVPLVAARGLAVGHGGRAVVAGVDLAVRPGERWFLVGANGAGKSTLLAGLLGLLPPLAGAVERAARRPALVPQRLAVPTAVPTTVGEVVASGRAGLSADPPRVAAAIAACGLAGLERRPFAALSGGQRQAAAIARAIARDPDLIAVDEPTTGLDAEAAAMLEAQVLVRPGPGVLCISHDDGLIRRHATHVARIADGGLRLERTP